MKTRKKIEKTWTTAYGKQIPLSKLEDLHLVNILAHLRRRKDHQDLSLELRADCMFGDAAQSHAEMMAEIYRRQTVESRFPVYHDLKLELKRRVDIQRAAIGQKARKKVGRLINGNLFKGKKK